VPISTPRAIANTVTIVAVKSLSARRELVPTIAVTPIRPAAPGTSSQNAGATTPATAGRSGSAWRAMCAANSVLIGTYSALLGSEVNRSLVLFFGLLLTMIIVLYDRFLAERPTRTAIA